jgi:hypothetical protein
MPLPNRLFASNKKKDRTSIVSIVELGTHRSDTGLTTQSNQSTSSVIEGWPKGPQRVGFAPVWIAADILLLMVPVAFIVLAILAYSLDGKRISKFGNDIQEAMLLSPTIYPLAFAACGGRSLKKIALWRAQEGTTLGFLEHVIGSQSLVAAIGHAITLHSLNFLTIGLLAFWALSPLGGQSALRLVHGTNKTDFDNRTVFYANVNAESQFPLQSYNQDALNRVNGVVSTALLTADDLETAPVDTWNHPKIPRLEALELADDKNETMETWHDVDPKGKHTYASLTGVNVVHLLETGGSNFTIPYEYMFFRCEASPHNNVTRSSTAAGVFKTSPNQQTQMKYLRDLNNANDLDSASHFTENTTSIDILGNRGFFFYTRTETENNVTKPISLIYGSKEIALTFYLFECSMHSIVVEANIICESSSCTVSRLGRLNTPRSSRKAKYLPYDVVNEAYTNAALIRHIAAIGGDNYSFAMANPVDTYIYGGTPWSIDETTGQAGVHNWTNLVNQPDGSGMEQTSQRLTRVMNTFWDASRWPVATTRNDPFALSSLNSTSLQPSPLLTMQSTGAITYTEFAIYNSSLPWTLSLILTSAILFLLAIYSLFLSTRIVVPDIFDYVSSFTRDNPYVDAPDGGSWMDGADRARCLQGMKVRLGDVEAQGSVGYIAVASMRDGIDGDEEGEGGNGMQGAKVARGRRYR